jgi:hypothetical protein
MCFLYVEVHSQDICTIHRTKEMVNRLEWGRRSPPHTTLLQLDTIKSDLTWRGSTMDLTYKFPSDAPKRRIAWRHESASLTKMSASRQPSSDTASI